MEAGGKVSEFGNVSFHNAGLVDVIAALLLKEDAGAALLGCKQI